MRHPALLPTLLLTAAAALSACGDDPGSGATAPAIRVVATTSQVADLTSHVGGDRVAVDRILDPGVDPHDFEPRPSDAKAVADAALVLRSGGALDGWLDDVVRGAGGDAPTVTLIDAVRTIEGGHEHAEDEEHEGGEDEHAGEDEHDEGVDPHWWQDPRNAVRAVERIRAALAEADPAGAGAYAENARAYVARIRRLDAAIERCMAAIPAERRKLVTNHDAFGYFAGRYDVEVLGAIVPSLSTAAQPSAGDVRRLVAAIRREGVTTIFPESAFNPRVERAVARDSGARVGPALYADSLGPKGSAGETYLGALRHDAAAMAAGFGGACRLPAP